jgi:hypothetical protein
MRDATALLALELRREAENALEFAPVKTLKI